MEKLTSIITVRTQSSRLQNKCLLNFGEHKVIEHIIKRCKDFNLNPILATTKAKSDDILCEIAEKYKIPFHRGSEKNKLLRWFTCCQEFSLKSFTTVDADDLFFCGEEVRRSFDFLHKRNLDMVFPYKSASSGSGMVGFSIKEDLIKSAINKIPEDTDTEMAWSFLSDIPNRKYIELNPPNKYEVSGRLTLDYWEDYIFLESLRIILKKDFSRMNIFKVISRNPDLCKINSFRNVEWKQNQIAKYKT